jgi:signal transduction histidine kinase
LHVRAAITGPVLVDGELVGLLTISRTRPLEPGSATYFAPWDVDLIADVGRLAGQAIAQARLGEQLTSAEAARLAAEEAARQRDEFLSIASHELKTPVTSLKLNLQLAQRRLGGLRSTGDQQSLETLLGTLLPRTNYQVDRLTRLIDDLLDVSRIATDKLALRLEPCDLTEIVNLVVREQRQHNPTRDVSLAAPPGAVRLSADPDRIGQVVTNYLTNALKYSPEEAPVEVRVTRDDATARVDVRDFGPGILATEHERIWERFYRAPDIDVQAGSGIGLGLGLYICKSIIERHGGRVGVESAPGEGSRFWFTVPLLESDAQSSRADGPNTP